jgi:hypothetical protein
MKFDSNVPMEMIEFYHPTGRLANQDNFAAKGFIERGP